MNFDGKIKDGICIYMRFTVTLIKNIIFYAVSDIDIGIGQYATKGYILLKRIEIYPKKMRISKITN